MSENLKKYRLNILNSVQLSKRVLESIPIFMGCLGSLIPFAPQEWPKNLLVGAYIIICIILWISFYVIKYNVDCINADNKYLDEEVLLLKELGNEFDTLKTSVRTSQNKFIQAAPFMAALDYTINGISAIILRNNITYPEFKQLTESILYNINKVIHYFYRDYQETLTLALYYYCEPTQEFYDYISFEAGVEAEIKRKGRIWSINDEAHICYVARHKETDEFIFNDINKDLRKPENFQENDTYNYVSSMSVPIFYPDGKQIRAVLSLTSNFPNRFDRTHETNIIDNNINTILLRTFYSIAKLIELSFNKIYPNDNKFILKDILEVYNKEKRLNEIQKDFLQTLSIN